MSVDISPDTTDHVLGAGRWFDPVSKLLIGSQCTSCLVRSFPPRTYCGHCGETMSRTSLPSIGRVVARSRVHVAPAGFPDTYSVGVVQLCANLHVFARFEGAAPEHGTPVRVDCGIIRENGDDPVFGPVFKAANDPLPEQDAPPDPPVSQPRPTPSHLGVTLAGVATTPFGHSNLPTEQLAAEAALGAVADAGLRPAEIDAVVVGSAFSTTALGQRMLRHVPWGGCRLVNVENACASGTTALAEAVALVRAGLADTAVAVGADTPASSGGGLIQLDHDDPVSGIGITLPALYALVGDHYLERYGTSADAFYEVVVRSRVVATANPDASRRETVTKEQVRDSRPIADPLTLYQCAPNADGAAAVVVTAERLQSKLPHPPIELAALGLHSGFAKDRFSGGGVVNQVSQAVYAAAGINSADIGVVELHDAFAPGAVTNIEHLGLAEPGSAANQLLAGEFRGGSKPALNPSGGLLSRGHPPGATGLAQATELVRQLRGAAGERQLSDPGVALLHTMGGTVLELEANACTIGILRRKI